MKKIKDLYDDIMIKLEAGEYNAIEILLAVIITFLLGVILGMLISPRKNANMGCDSGNTYHYYASNDDEEDDDEDEE